MNIAKINLAVTKVKALWWLRGGMIAVLVAMIAIFNLVAEPIYLVAGLSLVFFILFIIYARKVKPQGGVK